MEKIDNEYYVSPEVAKLLEKAGFDWRCKKYYNKGVLFDMESDEIREQCPQHSSYDVLAPTLDVAQRWLREVKHCFVNVNIDVDDNECEDTIVVDQFTCKYIIEGFPYCNNSPGDDYIRNVYGDKKYFNLYEEAQEAGIKKVLEILLKEGE